MNYLKGVRGDRKDYIRCLREFSPKAGTRALTDFIGDMPERYILSTPVKKVAEDYQLVQKAGQTGFEMRIDGSADGVVEISISAEDSPGLFSRIVGFLSSKGLNIVNGRIFTGKKGMVIDKISVSNWKDVWWEGLEEDIGQGLAAIITGGMPVSIVCRREKRPEGPYDVFIELDNEASEEYSIIEIFTPDRIGLLYDISSIMHSMGVNIESARIHTEAGLAQDIFYVSLKKDKIDYVTAQELMAELWTILRG
jgi:[protein-PII] uridylyltransferase